MIYVEPMCSCGIIGCKEHKKVDDVIVVTAGENLEAVEKELVGLTMKKFGFNRTRSASSLGISVRTLQRKLKSWKMWFPQPIGDNNGSHHVTS